ncbi:MAG: hypothetical protein HMLIMOIP_000918 [Candidatus Nitrosomirales archaeon]
MVRSNSRPTKIGTEKNFLAKAEEFLQGAKVAMNDHPNAST